MQIYPLSNPKLDWPEKIASHYGFGFGICPICGKLTKFRDFSGNLRENGFCKVCNSSNRQRQMATMLLLALHEATNLKFTSISSFTEKAKQHSVFSNFNIFNTETTGALHTFLKNLEGYTASEYLGDSYRSGEIVNGVLHQNLVETSFDTSSFDIVLSSDVFEHIPNPYQAFTETYRILRPGGRHIFTVPFYSHRYRDEIRTIIDEQGNTQHLLPPEYHGDPIRSEGILVYVIFSLEMLIKLNDIGYEVRMHNVRDPLKGILSNALVFDSIKSTF